MNVPETFFTVREELALFGMSCLGGAVIGLGWDVVRALRKAVPHRGWAVAAEDFLFLCGCLVLLPVFSAAFARGHIRGYFVLGGGIGFALYLLTLGGAVRGALSRLFMLLCAPFVSVYVLLCKKVKPFFVGSSKVIVKSIKKIGLLLHCRRKLLYNKMANKKGKNVELIGQENKRQS